MSMIKIEYGGVGRCSECGRTVIVECIGEVGSGRTNIDDWKYCPYCGKEIEVERE